MYGSTEVERLVGMDRNTRQRYGPTKDRKGRIVAGIVNPTKNSSGDLVYTEADVNCLMFAQLLEMCGYKRAKIKTFFSDPDLTEIEMLDKTLKALERRQKLITGLIRTITILKLLEKFPMEVGEVLRGKEGDASNLYQSESFAKGFKQAVVLTQSLDEKDMPFLNQGMLCIFGTLAIANCADQSDNSERGVGVVAAVFKTLLEAEREENPKIDNDEFAEMFLNTVREMIDDEECCATLEQYRAGSAEYVMRMVETYCNKYKNERT